MQLSSYWGFLFSISAGFLNSGAVTIQKNVLDKAPRKYFKYRTWWYGFIMLIVAEILGAFSFSLLPSSIAVGLSSFAILGITFLARNKEPITWNIIAGTICIITASFLNGLVTPPTKNIETFETILKYLLSYENLGFHIIMVCISAILHVIYLKYEVERFQLLGISTYAACMSSITIIWARTLVVQLLSIPEDCETNNCNQTFKNWILYVSVLVTIVTGFWAAAFVEQRGLANNPQTKWFPVHFVACTVTFSLAGVVVYDDWRVFNPSYKTMILIVHSFILYIWGIYMII